MREFPYRLGGLRCVINNIYCFFPKTACHKHKKQPEVMDLNKAKGVIYGLAIGDALGRLTEFMSLSRIKSKYGEAGITDLPEPALYTDDTQMSIAIAEALVRTGEQDIESIMVAVRDEFIKWRHSPENNRAPGNACLTGIANMERGKHSGKGHAVRF
jgi:ADP-ribosylglycohydrolase